MIFGNEHQNTDIIQNGKLGKTCGRGEEKKKKQHTTKRKNIFYFPQWKLTQVRYEPVTKFAVLAKHKLCFSSPFLHYKTNQCALL